HLERDRLSRTHPEAARGLLPNHSPRRHTGIWLRPDDRDAEASGTEGLRGALAVHADEIRHDVGGGLFTAIEEHRDAWRPRRGRRVLRDDRVGRVVGRAEFGNGRNLETILRETNARGTLRLPDER